MKNQYLRVQAFQIRQPMGDLQAKMWGDMMKRIVVKGQCGEVGQWTQHV
jgi:hypothetical protein